MRRGEGGGERGENGRGGLEGRGYARPDGMAGGDSHPRGSLATAAERQGRPWRALLIGHDGLPRRAKYFLFPLVTMR